MPTVVFVSFREPGKMLPFGPGSLDLRAGSYVVAETARGVELGMVRRERQEVPLKELTQPLRTIIREATPEDHAQARANLQREQEALGLCAAKIAKHGLPMRLLRAEYTLDRARIVFFFYAEGRVDFRELVKDLASTLRTRIELHQVGARDASKLVGGFGRCGRELCCTAWLTGFEPISMKMAKDQDLALNPTKFSGQCGKLMCCLRYEVELYRQAKPRLPRIGATIATPQGNARVVEINIPAERVLVEYQETGARVGLAFADVLSPCSSGCASGDGCAGCAGNSPAAPSSHR
ncbi:MAG TPA: stage 0 sporulation family protein [Armatimonadetes bacterium]|jgi:cell fate regulator YaaT (PSP1 superfamily)|nr:stage 0 sporulation family protein [Armatimonadota bacterium]